MPGSALSFTRKSMARLSYLAREQINWRAVMQFLCFSGTVFILSITQALAVRKVTAEDCEFRNSSTSAINYVRLFSKAQENDFPSGCTERFSPIGGPYPRRSLTFNSQGNILITVDGNIGKASVSVGSHSIYVLPTESAPTVTKITNKNPYYQVEVPEKYIWKLGEGSNPQKISLPENCHGSIVNPPKWTEENKQDRSGIYINSCQDKIVLDAGWRIGNRRELLQNGFTELRTTGNRSCKIKNKLIYNYGGYDHKEISLIIHSAKDWYQFLKIPGNCVPKNPDLLPNFEFLNKPTWAPQSPKKSRHAS